MHEALTKCSMSGVIYFRIFLSEGPEVLDTDDEKPEQKSVDKGNCKCALKKNFI